MFGGRTLDGGTLRMQRVRDDVLGERVWNSAADGGRADNVRCTQLCKYGAMGQ